MYQVACNYRGARIRNRDLLGETYARTYESESAASSAAARLRAEARSDVIYFVEEVDAEVSAAADWVEDVGVGEIARVGPSVEWRFDPGVPWRVALGRQVRRVLSILARRRPFGR